MPKLAPGVRLLRSLTRAGRLMAAAAARPAKAGAKSAPALQIRKHARPDVAPPPPGKWLTATHHAEGQRMSYWLYLPDSVPEAAAQHGWPLIVMLHGCHQSATQFAQGTRMNWLAEDKGYAVLYPQQSLSVQAQRCWRWYAQATQQGGGETAALASLVEKICARHPIDRRRVYACGLSAGAGMAAVLALNHPGLIAAVGLHSGPVFGAGHSTMGALHVMRHGAAVHADAAIRALLLRGPMPAMPAILIQGEDDHVVRPVNQQQLAQQWLQLNGLSARMAPRVTAKAAGRGRHAYEVRDYLVGRKVLLRVARIVGLGHAWSGGDPALKFNVRAGPNASRMMLEFFSKHRRSGT
ncbi:extracellular catalytic domain type 1 short-chain-length polyhydroxyalkanoate depolymerase [Pseudoduganella sp. RAF53_2]|uniref:extracellular catalytic domain type 1 short-chain-length polyhydroxyalkanoate depolymerase n=1 Tax=unclassified Pseudoduganella TaxID=2637179 RepID=UPI003F9E1D42